MVQLIIRDDDTNYFTKVSDLKRVYSEIPDFPVSFAVVPTVTDVSTIGACSDTKGNLIPRYVGENAELVEYLKKRLKEGTCDVLLHGITHGYRFDKSGGRQAEMVWRDEEEDLCGTIKHWKEDFEQLFDYPINCFVAPSNSIGKHAIKAVYKCGLNFSGIISIKYERDLDLRTIRNYLKRVYVRAVDGFAYPGIMDYGTHKELNATFHSEYDYLVELFKYCNNHNYPMAINVHYWQMRDDPIYYKGLFQFIKYAIDKGAIPTRLSDVFK